MKICVFCSSSRTVDKEFLDICYEFGKAMGKAGHTLVYGGYYEGCMGTLCNGVEENGGTAIGVEPVLFDEFGLPSDEDKHQVIKVQSLAERKQVMAEISDAFVTIPGGIGTIDECFEFFVLKGLGTLDKPMAIFNYNHFYDPLEAQLKKFEETNMMTSKARRNCPFFSDIDELLGYLSEWD